MDQRILEKIRKLLSLGTSNNEHEAQSAMAMAQQMMEKHQISEAMLAMDRNEPVQNQPVRRWEDPIYSSNNRSNWRTQLASVLATANNCMCFISYLKNPNNPKEVIQNDLKLIGKEDDVQTVRYLFTFAESEIDRLAKNYAGRGKSWINNYRLGCVTGIEEKLAEAQRNAREEMIYEHGQKAQNAIVKMDDAKAQVKQWVENNMKLQDGTPFVTKGDPTAYHTGRNDGRTIDLNSTKPGLKSGHKGLPGK